MGHRLVAALVLATTVVGASARADDSPASGQREVRDYPLILVHHPARLWTMKQFNQNYLSGYRALSRKAEKHLSARVELLLQLGLTIFTLAWTHEEGHRSILTTKNIGSISRPYPNADGAAYVQGVTDATLMDLRDNSLPTFVRLHTAGLESDYALGNRCTSLAAFEQEKLLRIWVECTLRRASHILYFALSPIDSLSPNLEEEANELERDIVGHDVLGAIRHLHRPTMPFYRYTDPEDLTSQEENFVTRVALRSLLNLFNPTILGRSNFEVAPGLKLSGSFGYSMSPFGDFIDENVWLLYKELRVHAYLRQLQGQERWYPAGGMRVVDYPVMPRVHASLELHGWAQPEGLTFAASQRKVGGMIIALARTRVIEFGRGADEGSMSVDVGFTAKTEGFAPEESYLGEKFGLQLGTTVRF